MDLPVHGSCLPVLGEVFGQQVTPIRRGIDEDVLRKAGQRSLECRLELLVTGFTGLEGEIIAEEDKAFGTSLQLLQHREQRAVAGEHAGPDGVPRRREQRLADLGAVIPQNT